MLMLLHNLPKLSTHFLPKMSTPGARRLDIFTFAPDSVRKLRSTFPLLKYSSVLKQPQQPNTIVTRFYRHIPPRQPQPGQAQAAEISTRRSKGTLAHAAAQLLSRHHQTHVVASNKSH